MKTFMFPGQGSQAKGMGATLFDGFRELTQQADEILGYSIKELCLEDPKGQLNKTEFTQPALYCVNALAYYEKSAGSSSKPDFVAGHSLGEFNALLAAECFDFATGLQLVQKRGALMGQIANGAMAAIVNATKEEIEDILNKNGLSNIDLANYNTPSQIVISGLADEIDKAGHLFQQGKMLYFPLKTSGAFHSRFMHPVQQEFRKFLATFELYDPKIPVIANVTARPYQKSAILENLASQLASTVRWSESIQYLMGFGTRRGVTMQFEEAGHGDVLTRLVQTIKRQTPAAVLEMIAKEDEQAEAAAADRGPQLPGSGPGSSELGRPTVAIDKVTLWNKQHPVGTRVKSLLVDYADLETRTEAVVLFGHRAAVYMKGYNGYFDLDEVVPL